MSNWHALMMSALSGIEYGFVLYVAAINLVYLVITFIGYFVLRENPYSLTPAERDKLLRSPMLPAVSVIVPAYNEAATIRDSVHAMLKQQYPKHEVIVVNDGSRDETLDILIREFRLYRSSRRACGSLPTRGVRAIYESLDPVPLVVVDKENGGKADALNAGLNVAMSPLVASVDADSLLDERALLMVSRPFLEDPRGTLAAGGIVRVVNGCTVVAGRVSEVRSPSRMLSAYQAIEYLRAFLASRVAFGFMNSLLVVSGAFGMFSRKALLEAGGFSTATVGEDMEIVVRLHHEFRGQGRPYRIVFVPDPVCWTMVPETLHSLRQQRNRWQRGGMESLIAHRAMIMNPRFGTLGLFAMPFLLLFEILGPLVEICGYAFTVAGLAARLIDTEVAAAFFLVSVVLNVFLSTSAIVLAEFTPKRYPTVTDVGRLLAATLIEAAVLHPLLSVWRAEGVVDALRRKGGWGSIERTPFEHRSGAQPGQRFTVSS